MWSAVNGNDVLYVTECVGDTVSMFTRFLGYIGDGNGSSFKCPSFIVSNQTGRLYTQVTTMESSQ